MTIDEATNREVQCGEKRKLSYNDARKQAKWLRRNKDDARAQEYKCRFCHWWHVGNNKPKKVRRGS